MVGTHLRTVTRIDFPAARSCKSSITMARSCYGEIEKGKVEHLLVLLGVPIAYPRLVWLENILTSRLMDPIKALGKFGFLGNFLNRLDGGVEVLDDLDDHWTAKNHKHERAIVIEHASMSSTSDLMGPILGVGPASRVFQFASYTFDVSNQDVFTTLQRGGCVCVPSEEDRVNDPAGAIERLQANFANLTNTMMGLIGRPERVPSLKRLVNLGEPPPEATTHQS